MSTELIRGDTQHFAGIFGPDGKLEGVQVTQREIDRLSVALRSAAAVGLVFWVRLGDFGKPQHVRISAMTPTEEGWWRIDLDQLPD